MRNSLARLLRIARDRASRLSPRHRRFRRFNLQLQASSSWQLRAERAVELWVRNAHVLSQGADDSITIGDLGCGNERLRAVLARHLGDRFSYQGYDLLPQTPTTSKLDLQRELPNRSFDLVFCLGLLEYMTDLEAVLLRLRRISDFAIVSYAISDSPTELSEAEREARGWLSHHSRADFSELGTRAGWLTRDFLLIDQGRTGLWLWASGAEASS